MGCIENLINYYTNIPIISISNDNLPKYVEFVNYIIDFTIKEYSECKPLLKEKTIITNHTQYQIDVYNDIDENFMDFIIFDKKENLINGFYLPNLQQYITPIITEEYKENSISFLGIQYIYDYLFMIQEYFKTNKKIFIYNGKYIKCQPNTEYYILYEAYRTRDEIYQSDCKNFEELFKVNLVLNMIDTFFMTDEQPIRSVSISGISVTFNVENKESVRRQLIELKSRVKNKLCNIYEFVERW